MTVLPSGYTELQWIQSNGMAWIDTGILSSDNCGVDICFQFCEPQVQQAWVYGEWENASYATLIGYYDTHFTVYDGPDNSNYYAWGDVSNHPPMDFNKHRVKMTQSDGYIFDNSKSGIVRSPAFSSTKNTHMFLFNRNVNPGETHVKVFYFKAYYPSGILRFEFIPARRDSDGALGMYDKVTNNFYTNDGIGEFISGPRVYKQQLFIGSSISKVFINDEINKIYIGSGLIWEKSPIFVDIPTVTSNLTYNGSPQSPTIGSYDHNVIQATYSSQINAGSYNVSFHLLDSEYAWSDGTTADKSVSWSIAKLSLAIPSVSGGGTYKGSDYTATVSNYNSTYETQIGTVSATNVGTYTVTWSLKSTVNTQWSNGTTGNKSSSWYIDRASVGDKPQADVYRDYNGSVLTNGYVAPSGVIKSGDDSGTDVRIYFAYYSVDSNHKWSDGTLSRVTVRLHIEYVFDIYEALGARVKSPYPPRTETDLSSSRKWYLFKDIPTLLPYAGLQISTADYIQVPETEIYKYFPTYKYMSYVAYKDVLNSDKRFLTYYDEISDASDTQITYRQYGHLNGTTKGAYLGTVRSTESGTSYYPIDDVSYFYMYWFVRRG